LNSASPQRGMASRQTSAGRLLSESGRELSDQSDLLFDPLLGWKPRNGSKKHPRLIDEKGNSQVRRRMTYAQKMEHYYRDMFTTLIDAPWWKLLASGAAMYIGVWLSFAILYWNFNNEDVPFCQKSELDTFMDALLLSIDSQTTIGFGNYSVDSDCFPGVIVLIFQCLCSVILDASFMGLVFAKISRPQSRAATLVFSSNVCISSDDSGNRFLSIRVADQRKRQLVEAQTRLLMYYTPRTKLPPNMEVGQDGAQHLKLAVEVEQLKLMQQQIFLLLPCTIVHKIDETSPLYDLTELEMRTMHIEFVYLVEGTTPSTGMLVQARRSYIASQVLFNTTFQPCITLDSDGDYQVHFDMINAVQPCLPPPALGGRRTEGEASSLADPGGSVARGRAHGQ
jgi:hypothetical protein